MYVKCISNVYVYVKCILSNVYQMYMYMYVKEANVYQIYTYTFDLRVVCQGSISERYTNLVKCISNVYVYVCQGSTSPTFDLRVVSYVKQAYQIDMSNVYLVHIRWL